MESGLLLPLFLRSALEYSYSSANARAFTLLAKPVQRPRKTSRRGDFTKNMEPPLFSVAFGYNSYGQSDITHTPLSCSGHDARRYLEVPVGDSRWLHWSRSIRDFWRTFCDIQFFLAITRFGWCSGSRTSPFLFRIFMCIMRRWLLEIPHVKFPVTRDSVNIEHLTCGQSWESTWNIPHKYARAKSRHQTHILDLKEI